VRTVLIYFQKDVAGTEKDLGWDNSVGIATGWTVRGSNSGGDHIFRIRPDPPWGPLSLLYSAYRVFFLGIKRPGFGLKNTHSHLLPRIKKE
jgi:hypothetical protein